jgi:hypothetical protein
MRLRWTTPAAHDLYHIVRRIQHDNPDSAAKVARLSMMVAAAWEHSLAVAAREGLRAPASWSSLACPTSLSTAFKIKVWRSCASITQHKTGLDVPRHLPITTGFDVLQSPAPAAPVSNPRALPARSRCRTSRSQRSESYPPPVAAGTTRARRSSKKGTAPPASGRPSRARRELLPPLDPLHKHVLHKQWRVRPPTASPRKIRPTGPTKEQANRRPVGKPPSAPEERDISDAEAISMEGTTKP